MYPKLPEGALVLCKVGDEKFGDDNISQKNGENFSGILFEKQQSYTEITMKLVKIQKIMAIELAGFLNTNFSHHFFQLLNSPPLVPGGG